MAAYGFGYIRNINPSPGIIEYLEHIDDTLEPFKGVFVAHGGEHDVLEGDLPSGRVVLLEFPDFDDARRWYASDTHQAIKPLRTDNAHSHILIVDGVPRDHRATGVITEAQARNDLNRVKEKV